MAIATFANKVFEVNTDKTYTFSDIQYSSSLQTEKQDSDGAKPSTYIKGPDLDTLEFKLTFDVQQGISPRREWEDWQSIMNSQRAYQFILGSKPVGSYSWLLTGVTPSSINVDNSGNILSMTLDLKFDEYVRAGSTKKDTESGSASVNASAPASAPAVEQASDVDVVSQLGVEDYAMNKAEEKRLNNRMRGNVE